MLIRKVVVENVRSFLDRQELEIEGPISILIGPNGGGKTNLLDIIVTMLRRYLIATKYAEVIHHSGDRVLHQLRENQVLANLTLERHSEGSQKRQLVQLTIEVSASDLANMQRMKNEAQAIAESTKIEWISNPWDPTTFWSVEDIAVKQRFTYIWQDGALVGDTDGAGKHFLEYLQLFEYDNQRRGELNVEPLQLPMIYLPVNRTGGGFQSNIRLSDFDEIAQKRNLDAISSRSPSNNILSLAIGRLAQRRRDIETQSNINIDEAFFSDENMDKLRRVLSKLGYDWRLELIDRKKNDYRISLSKQGIDFTPDNASSGEREILTYLFAIYALNVRDAVVVVDEPELHLHPSWQRSLLSIFEDLADDTGNQFVLATHSPTFVSPASIQYVSRIYVEEQKSIIHRLNSTQLPNSRHLFNIVNSHNNEKIFFCDKVILVEGISDRIFFDKIFDRFDRRKSRYVFEIVSVGGKGFFAQYEKILRACDVDFAIIADLDYIEEVGTDEVKGLFKFNAAEIKKKVINDVGSLDGTALVAAIDAAMSSGNWTDAQNLWLYIKSRRKKLRSDLSPEEQRKLEQFLATKGSTGCHILSRGALESYLPQGHASKELEKLILLLEQKDYWELLPQPGRSEIEALTRSILGAVGSAGSPEVAPRVREEEEIQERRRQDHLARAAAEKRARGGASIAASSSGGTS